MVNSWTPFPDYLLTVLPIVSTPLITVIEKRFSHLFSVFYNFRKTVLLKIHLILLCSTFKNTINVHINVPYVLKNGCHLIVIYSVLYLQTTVTFLWRDKIAREIAGDGCLLHRLETIKTSRFVYICVWRI